MLYIVTIKRENIVAKFIYRKDKKKNIEESVP